MRESHRRIQERFPRRPLELPPLFGQRPPPAAACLRLQFGQSVSSSATAASVALDTNRNSARPALQNRRSHSSNCALHPGSSRHGLALASPVRQTRAGPQYQLAASCVANPLVSHVKGGACSKDCLPPSPCSTSSSLRSFNASRDDSKAKKPKIPTAERQNFNCRELSRLGRCAHRFLAIAQWFVHLSAHPQPMQQYRQLSSYCHYGSLLGIFSSSLRKLPSPSPQITVFSKRPQNVMCSLHHHRSQIPVSFLADFLLWFALPGVPAARS